MGQCDSGLGDELDVELERQKRVLRGDRHEQSHTHSEKYTIQRNTVSTNIEELTLLGFL